MYITHVLYMYNVLYSIVHIYYTYVLYCTKYSPSELCTPMGQRDTALPWNMTLTCLKRVMSCSYSVLNMFAACCNMFASKQAHLCQYAKQLIVPVVDSNVLYTILYSVVLYCILCTVMYCTVRHKMVHSTLSRT